MSQSLDTNANLAIRHKTTISSMLTFIAVIHKNKWCINFSLLLVFLNTVNTADAQWRYISCCPTCFSMRVNKIVRNKNTFDLASSDSEYCTSCISQRVPTCYIKLANEIFICIPFIHIYWSARGAFIGLWGFSSAVKVVVMTKYQIYLDACLEGTRNNAIILRIGDFQSEIWIEDLLFAKHVCDLIHLLY